MGFASCCGTAFLVTLNVFVIVSDKNYIQLRTLKILQSILLYQLQRWAELSTEIGSGHLQTARKFLQLPHYSSLPPTYRWQSQGAQAPMRRLGHHARWAPNSNFNGS